MTEPTTERVDERTMAAIAAAVYGYISAEEAALAAAMTPRPQRPEPRAGLWSLSGRQAQMNQRVLMQLRAFR